MSPYSYPESVVVQIRYLTDYDTGTECWLLMMITVN